MTNYGTVIDNQLHPAPLPYDAEVEYLESTGMQWIDTGIAGRGGLAVSCRFSHVGFKDESSIVSYIYGSYYASRVAFNLYANKNSSVFVSSLMTSNTSTGIALDNAWHDVISVSAPSQSAGGGNYYQKFDGQFVKGPTINTGSNAVLTTFRLFAIHNADIPSATGREKIAAFSVRDTSTGQLLLDLIPVRKNGVGYMYDKVSGTLLGNAGTGDFVLGPDKPYDYEVAWVERD